MGNNLTGNNMVFGTTSFMYKQVPPGDPEQKGISEDDLDAVDWRNIGYGW
jgi:hypothetical protein